MQDTDSNRRLINWQHIDTKAHKQSLTELYSFQQCLPAQSPAIKEYRLNMNNNTVTYVYVYVHVIIYNCGVVVDVRQDHYVPVQDECTQEAHHTHTITVTTVKTPPPPQALTNKGPAVTHYKQLYIKQVPCSIQVFITILTFLHSFFYMLLCCSQRSIYIQVSNNETS